MTGELKTGHLIQHSTFGLGKVVSTTADKVFVYFRDIGDQKAKRFFRSYAGITLSDIQSDPILDNLPPFQLNGDDWKLQTKPMTPTRAIAKFLAIFPEGFKDPKYLTHEREYKEEAHKIFVNLLGNGQLSNFLEQDDLAEIVKRSKSIIQSVNLPSVFERIAFTGALQTQDLEAPRRYFLALNKLLSVNSEQDLEKVFGAYLQACSKLKQTGKSPTFTWPIVTLFPFLAQPEKHIFLKPKAAEKLANTMAFDLQYKSTPNWKTYSRLLEMMSVWKNQIAVLEPRDMFDAQSFMFIINGGYDNP